MEATVQKLFSAGLAPATQRSYQSGARRFLEFCGQADISPPFPLSERTLIRFVAWMFEAELSCSTMKSYLAAARHTQIALGLGDPHMGEMPQLEYVLKGSKRLGRGPSRVRLPITPEILFRLKQVWGGHSNFRDACMLWAAASTCFFGFLRSGEVCVPSDSSFDPAVHLAYGDVRVNDTTAPEFIEVRLKASKTDPFRHGVSVFLGKGSVELCPVAAVLGYMVQRGSSGGPFFKFDDGRFLTRERFVSCVRLALRSAGYNPTSFAGHSFRIGAATAAAQRGLQDSLIKTLGRWESSAYTLYVRTPREVLCAVAGSLARRNPSAPHPPGQ